jgi:C4-dicarboxylate-specific signal transduction histidine kinase
LLLAANRAAVYGQVSRWLIHDLRNPTQALTLITELMSGEPGGGDDGAKGMVQAAAAHLTRSLELLDRALHQPERGADPRPVSLRHILEFIEALHRVHRSPIALDLSAAHSLPLPAVAGSEAHLVHALLNLIVNALDAFGDRVEGRIVVAAEVDRTRLTLHISDDGPGFPEEIRDRLFEPFVTTKIEGPPSGLGLTVARQLLTWYGGGLRYLPADGAGARLAADFLVWR